MQFCRVQRTFGAHPLILETGKIAKQAHGAVIATYGETMVLSAAVEGSPIPGRDFFPLTCDYREKVCSAGKFPGGFIKREGRPTTKETLTSRLIDRPIRPLFPPHYLNEVQVQAMTLSADRVNDPDVLAMIASSAALHVSHIPFVEPTGSIRIGRVNGQFVILPNHTELEESDLDLVVAGTKKAITMIEGFAREMPEEQMLQAILFAHEQVVAVVELIEELREQAGVGAKPAYPAGTPNPLIAEFERKYYDEFKRRKQTSGKADRAASIQGCANLFLRVFRLFVFG